jgi:hypothetical protein
MALQRLCCPGSDLQGSGWVKTVEADGFDRLELQHFYRTCGFVFAVRQDLEPRLFFRDRDLFSTQLDLVFVDTTSLCVYRDTETLWRKWGYSRDRRGDLTQFVLCVAVDRHGWPVAWEVFPGHTADRPALRRIVEILRQRFKVRSVIIVADRGMIARDTIALLTQHPKAPFNYILGCRMRRQREVSEEVLARAGRYEGVAEKDAAARDAKFVLTTNTDLPAGEVALT